MGKAEKLKDLPVAVGNMGGSLIQVAIPYAIQAAVAKMGGGWIPAAALFLLRHFPGFSAPAGNLFIEMLKGLHDCFLRRGAAGGVKVKMMKAPGRNYKIPRAGFESDPAAYFRALRGK